MQQSAQNGNYRSYVAWLSGPGLSSCSIIDERDFGYRPSIGPCLNAGVRLCSPV